MHNKSLKKLGFLIFSALLMNSSLSFAQQIQPAEPRAPRRTSPQEVEPVRSVPGSAQTSPAPVDIDETSGDQTTGRNSIRGPRISAINIIGNKKIEKEAILIKLISKVGGAFSDKTVVQDIEALYKMGFFVQIEVSKENQGQNIRLEYRIVEKPTVSEIIFEGNSDQKAEDLEGQLTIKAFEILDNTKIKESVMKLEKFYEEKGFYLVKIQPVVEDVQKDETVKVKFVVTENDKVKVKKITFIGNDKLKDSFLKGRLFTQEAGFFSSISSSGSFKQEAFERDIQILKYMYWNLGYVQVKIDRPLVTVTPDKKSIYITYHIDEGAQYSVGEIDFAGDLLFSKTELMGSVKIKDNGIFAVDVMQKDIADLQAKYGDLGYAFANVIPRYAFHEQDKKVDLVFEFEKGQKVYFGTINVVGNTKSRDKVLRRELKVREGELYHETRKRESQENIQRLGFFEEVNFKTSTPPDKPNQLNIDIVVKERNTGQLQLTAGYGSVNGPSIGGSIQQNNFRGLGQTLGARIDATKNRQDYSLSLTEPYVNDTPWSAGFDLFYIENKERINYDNRKTGAAIRLGHPVWGENVRGYFRYKLDKTDLFANKDTDPLLFPLETAKGVTSSGTVTLEYDTRNDRFAPSKGIYADVSYERTGLGGDLRYQEFSTRLRYFKNIFWDVVWRNNLAYANLQPLDEGEQIPFSERYQLGGAYSLRGFGSGTIGRRLYSQTRYDQVGTPGSPFYIQGISEEDRRRRANLIFGGSTQVLFQTELQFPLIKEAGLTGVFFYDIGQANDEIRASELMSDFGIGFRWMSPLGLLRFEWGWPLSTDPGYDGHEAVNFEFSIGPPF